MRETLQKISRNGQITVPKEFRQAMNIKDGDLVQVHKNERGALELRFYEIDIKEKAVG